MGSKGSKKHDHKYNENIISEDRPYITKETQTAMSSGKANIPGMTNKIPGQMSSAQMNTASNMPVTISQVVPAVVSEMPGTVTSTVIPGMVSQMQGTISEMPGESIRTDVYPSPYTTITGQTINTNPSFK
jgi:hypothetical protein